MKVLLLQGANMEALGRREPELYGTITGPELDALLVAQHPDDELDIRYTNTEGEAISWIYEADTGDHDGLVMNPAGFLHSGTALRDCVATISMPCVEVHMTNIDARGMHSVTASESAGMITGLGVQSYMLALRALPDLLSRSKEAK